MPAPIALQLYSIRDELNQDFESGIRKIAAMGYAGVEPAGFPGSTPQAAARLFRELDLAVPSAHVALPLGDEKQQTLDTMAALGSTCIVSGLGPDNYLTVDDTKKSCETFNQAAAVAAEHGMTFAIHNHWWEFLPLDSRHVYKVMLDYLTPEVLFEVDTYWAKVAGLDPAPIVRELGARAPLLHIKDGPGVKEQDMVAVGQGVMDIHSIVEAGRATVQWMIIELDSCATDMMDALQQSYTYLTNENLAQGKP